MEPIRNLWVAALFAILVQLTFSQVAVAARVSTSETIAYDRAGDFVNFNLSSRPSVLRLQGLVPTTGRWSTLVSRNRPAASLSRLKIPSRWRGAQLRVVVTHPASASRREPIPVQVDWTTRSASFTTIDGARLFSVESKSADSWKRISTVAASQTPKTVTVPLPASLAEGTEVRVVAVSGSRKSFPSLATPLAASLKVGPSAFAARREAFSARSLSGSAPSGAPANDTTQPASSPTEETDIWKVRGERIYFYNRLRGLQVLKPSNPADRVITGSLPLAGTGEEMYLLGSATNAADSAVLISAIPWSSPATPDSTRLSRVALSNDTPSLQTSLDLPGYYVDSRLVGGLLHVVTATWVSSTGEWAPRTFVTTVDLSQPGTLVAMPRREFSYSASAVGSTAKYFWISFSRADAWNEQALFAFAYRTDGSLADPLEAELSGAVQDKFKVGDTANGLAAIVQSWNVGDWKQTTSIETFREEAGALVSAAKIELVRGESLFATRFSGNRLYAVTYEQTDPLWIVDLSDPAVPVVAGRLEIPGYSTFIQPVGDILLAVGRDGGKTQVSMFDVADPANPRLVRRVDLGGGSGWSWSEAEWNEKAVNIMPEAGLILIPVVDWSGGTRRDLVNLIDFNATSRTLDLRGAINHAFAPRRAALMDNSVIASVSNRELLLVDAADRNNPVIKADVVLANGADRILVAGGTAIFIENGGDTWSGSPRSAMLRSAPVADTESIISQTTLPCDRVDAAEIIDGRLVLVETSAPDAFVPASVGTGVSAANSSVSVWSLADPARPMLVGRTALSFSAADDTEILSVEAGRVAVVSRDAGWNFWVRSLPVFSSPDAPVRALSSLSVLPMGRILPPWIGWGRQALRLAIVDPRGTAPNVLGTWELSGEEFGDISEVYSAGELLAFSFDKHESLDAPGLIPDAQSDWTGKSTRTWLQILDLANPSSPTAWAPVQLPGRLVGVSWLQRAGGVVLARAGERIAALGFDGENASVVAEVEAANGALVVGDEVFEGSETGVSGWKFSETKSRWEKLPGWNFDNLGNLTGLYAVDGALLAGGYGQAWILGQNGNVSARSVIPGARLDLAVRQGESYLVPAGEYGVLSLSPR